MSASVAAADVVGIGRGIAGPTLSFVYPGHLGVGYRWPSFIASARVMRQ